MMRLAVITLGTAAGLIGLGVATAALLAVAAVAAERTVSRGSPEDCWAANKHCGLRDRSKSSPGCRSRHGSYGVQVELFHGVNIDWLGKKWYFLGFSLIFSVAGLLSIFFWHGIPLGIDFKGGTLVYVKFDAPPSADRIRDAVDRAGIRDSRIQPFGQRIGRGLRTRSSSPCLRRRCRSRMPRLAATRS